MVRTIAAGALGLVAGVTMSVSMLQSQGAAPDHTVTQAQFDGWKKELSNWGRWGKEDEKGTLNLITPAKRRQAADLVRDGVAVSLARDADTEKSIDNANPYEQVMRPVGQAASSDRLSVSFHGYAHTHLDALGHHFLEGKLYNGFARDEYVTQEGGAKKGAIINAKSGIFTRGILMDIPRLKGVPYLEPGTPIYVEDLEAWEMQAGVKVSAGDAVFIRTGRWIRRAKQGPWNVSAQQAGLDASVLPWLRKRDVAIIGSESALSVTPIPPSSQITNPDDYLPVHNFVLVALGMNVFDNCDLDALAEAAAARRRWEFLITAAPLPIVRGTGSPINPSALF
jgi:kynurenine formamidase